MISSFYPQNVIHITVCIFIIRTKASLYWHKMERHGCLEKSNHCPGCYGTVGHTLDTHGLMTILFYKEVAEAMFFNCLLLHRPESTCETSFISSHMSAMS